jgi:hypothetical protein
VLCAVILCSDWMNVMYVYERGQLLSQDWHEYEKEYNAVG